MADIEMLMEAERRGILPEDKKALLAEARSRGLVPTVTGSGTSDDPHDTGHQVTVTPEGGKIEARKEPGAMEYLGNRAVKGAAGFLGTPGDLVNMVRGAKIPLLASPLMSIGQSIGGAISDKLGISSIPTDRFIATGDTYRKAAETAGLYDPKMTTDSPGLRYAGGVAEMAGAGGPMALAKGAALPVLSSSIGSGIGMEAGGDIAEGIGLSREAGQAVGAFAGGLVPSLASPAIGGAASFAKNRFSPAAQRAKADGAVANEVFGSLESYPQAKANLNRSLEVSDEFSKAGLSYTPSLPARTGAPGLLAAEKQLVSNSPRALDTAVQNIEANEQAVQQFVSTRIPAAGPVNVVQRVAKLQKLSAERLAGMRTAVDDKLDEVARRVETAPRNEALGQQVRDLLVKQKEAYRATARQKYGDVYKTAEEMGVRENVDDLVAHTNAVLKADLNMFQQSEIPSIYREVQRKFGAPEGGPKPNNMYYQAPAPKDVSFEELHSLYKRVNADLAETASSLSPAKDTKLLLLNQTKTMLTDKLAKFEDRGYGPVAEKFSEANRFYRDEYLPRFKQGFGADVLQRDQTASGGMRVPNEKVVDLITRGNNASAAKDFKTLFDDVPEAWQALRDGYMDVLYRQKGVLNPETGRINQKALDGFLRTNNQTLAEFPQVRREFEALARDNTALLERRGRIVAQEKELAQADMFKLVQGKDPAVVLNEAMSNPNVMRLLSHHAAGDPRQASALARSIADHVAQQADPAAFLKANRETIEAGLQSLGKDHMKNVETAVEALTINRRNELPTFVKSQGVQPDNIAENLGSSPRAIIAHILNVERGRSGPAQEGAAFLGRWFDKLRRDHKAIAMERVFYDKDAARAIANLSRNPASPKFRADWTSSMGALGIRASVAGQDGGEQ